MEHFSYSFIVTLFHSLWQLALLLGACRVLDFHFNTAAPIVRRNFLFILLLTQVLSSAVTFIFYYFNIIDGSLYGPEFFPALALRATFLQLAAPYIALVYSVTVILKLGSYFYRWQAFNNSTIQSIGKVPASIKLFTQLKAQEFGITRQVSLWYSNAVHSPVVYGFIKPVILLPISLATQLSIKETETLIVHELAHIRNNDYVLNWFLIITENVYFFNPFMKILASNIRMEREKACDIQVLMFKYTALDYAAALLTTARLGKNSLSFQLAAVTEKSLLLQRIRYFSKYEVPQRRRGILFPLALVVALFVMSIFAVTKSVSPGQEVKSNSEKATTYKILFPARSYPGQNSAGSQIARVNVEQHHTIITKPRSETGIRKSDYSKTVVRPAVDFTDDASPKPSDEFQPTAVAFPLNRTNDSARQVIINEESSQGEVLTRAYKVKLVNGQWISEPLWVLKEKHPRKDSVYIKADSAFRIVPPVQ